MTESKISKAIGCLRWLPAYIHQRCTRRESGRNPAHLIIALADHFEPTFLPEAPTEFAEFAEQERRLEEWCRIYPKVFDAWRDSEGFPFRHTYFSPAEQYERSLIDRLAEHCQRGWGEIEIHLHHGIKSPDTAENTRRAIVEFRDALARHGCLSRMNGDSIPRYAFVHGNWALANSARGRFCGVDEEMKILAETGCYADMTLPSTPSPAQTSKINSLYECALPLDVRAPHRRGRNLRVGREPSVFPLMIQGPLCLNFSQRAEGLLPVPKIESGALTSAYPPTLSRLHLWQRTAITVEGKPDWVFIKLHCHGMDPTDREAMLGNQIQSFLKELTEDARTSKYVLHFTTAREMTNIILAACDGLDGNPGEYRDYRL